MSKKTKIQNLYKDYKQIESIRDLVARGLSLADYDSLLNVINELAVHFESNFIQLSIAKYLKKFNVKIKEGAINYIATI